MDTDIISSNSDNNRVGMASLRAVEQQQKPTLHASPGLGNWLKSVNGSLAFSTYQSARIFFVSPGENDQTLALERIVGSAMGLAVDKQRLWISNQQQIWCFNNVGARTLGKQSFDAVYLPRRGYLLGGCDTHDLLTQVRYQGQLHDLLFVNTNFSCIAALDDDYNFRPLWKPDFITELAQEDRCHLNGMCARDGELAYATLCVRENTALAWRQHKLGGGCVIDIASNEVVCAGLSMPHSPNWHDGKLWLLNSAVGDFGYLDAANGQFTSVGQCPGFARGLSFVGGYAVIGISKLRESSWGNDFPLKARLQAQHVRETCGLLVIDPQTGKLLHWLTLEGPVTELYDVVFLPGVQKPYTPGFSEDPLHRGLIHVPNDPKFPYQPLAAPTAANEQL